MPPCIREIVGNFLELTLSLYASNVTYRRLEPINYFNILLPSLFLNLSNAAVERLKKWTQGLRITRPLSSSALCSANLTCFFGHRISPKNQIKNNQAYKSNVNLLDGKIKGVMDVRIWLRFLLLKVTQQYTMKVPTEWKQRSWNSWRIYTGSMLTN